MHICMICGTFPPTTGGLGYYVYSLSRRLVRRGHRVTVITRNSWKTYYEEIDGIGVYRVRFIPVYPFHLQVHGFFLSRLLRSMESDFDIVHLHSHALPVIHTSLPTVVTEHGTAKGYMDRLALSDLVSVVQRMFSKMFVSIDRKIVSSADRIIAVSNACADELRIYYGLKDVEVINNGVDTNLFVPIDNQNQGIYVLFSGFMYPIKGLEDLIKSAKYVCQECQNIRFVLAGKGPSEKNLKKLVHQLNLDKNFSFEGYVNQSKILDYYQNATVCVLPSHYEGLPTVLLEAMSCGIPTVATDVGGNPEVVVHGETGLLVPPKDPKKLAEAIIKLLGDEKLRKRMSKNGRKRVERYYDWEKITDKIERVYESITR